MFAMNKKGRGVKIGKYCVIYQSRIGEKTHIGNCCTVPYSLIGQNCRIGHLCSLCRNLVLEDYVFIGNNCTFIDNKYPSVIRSLEKNLTEANSHEAKAALIRKGASIGAGSVIFQVEIGEGALIGAGSVVTHNVPAGEVWAGVPARKIGGHSK